MKELVIVNGKVEDETYEHEFHMTKNPKNMTLTLFLLVPGIRANTIVLIIEENVLRLRTAVQKRYYQIYKSKNLSITGNLPLKVNPKVFTIEYNDGIVEIQLVQLRAE